MKVENLEKAVELKGQLGLINNSIKCAESATFVFLSDQDLYPTIFSCNLKRKKDKDSVLKAVKPLYLSILKKERNDILKEIDKLD